MQVSVSGALVGVSGVLVSVSGVGVSVSMYIECEWCTVSASSTRVSPW